MEITNEILIESQERVIKHLIKERHRINESKIFRKEVAQIRQIQFENKLESLFEKLREIEYY
jgi:hypothetical protein